MDVVRWAIERPVGVAVGVILLVMAGLIGLTRIPVQLAPDVDVPIITVTTTWAGRSPEEVVEEITKEQEERLKSTANLKSMRSVSREGASEISLEFTLGADINRALQEVSDKLRQVPEYPDGVDEPFIKAAEGASENAIAWMIIDIPPEVAAAHPQFEVAALYDALEKEVKPYLERIDGVAEVNIYGGREREVRVLVDPAALAQRGLTHLDVAAALEAENRNVSAGTIAEGKRDYRVRVLGQYTTSSAVLDTVVAYRDGRPVLVRDVATVEIGHEKPRGFVRSTAGPCLAMNCIRQSNANVVDIMRELRARLEDVRAQILPTLDPEVGPHLRLRQVYDETVYIDSSIDLVTSNIWQGGTLAVLVLLLFLRAVRPTAIVALTMPISAIGVFVIMLAMGRTINVISLAGLAFAVGIVIDNAIVVLENIDRRLKMGEEPRVAAYRGGREVWGAVLASTLTTVVVFIPVLTIEEEAGQLFKDISLAIVSSNVLSLVVSITVIPAAAALLLRRRRAAEGRVMRALHGAFGLARAGAAVAGALSRWLLWCMTGWRAWTVRPAVILGMTAASLVGSWLLIPPLDYLPAGNRNLVFGGLLIPPGYSVEQQVGVAQRIESIVRPYIEVDPDDPAAVAALPKIFRFDAPQEPFEPVPVENFFIGSFNGGMFVGATSDWPRVVIPVGALVTQAMNTIPDAYGGAAQASLFGRGIRSGNTVNVEVAGPDLERVRAAVSFMLGAAGAEYGFGNVRADPSNFNLEQPEWRVTVTDQGRQLGLTTAALGVVARGLFDGYLVGDFNLNGDNVDLVVLPAGGRFEFKEQILSVPVATPAGRIVPLESVAAVTPGLAPQEIQRVEELPAVTLQITPPKGRTVEEIIAVLDEKVVGPARASGLIDPTMRVRMEGTAAKLEEVNAALFGVRGQDGPMRPWQVGGLGLSALVMLGFAAAAALALARAGLRRVPGRRVGALGLVSIGAVIAACLAALAWQPQLIGARMVWALLVTYFVMCILYNNFAYPLVIMMCVPLAIVGGFAGLRIIHDITAADPVMPTQNLDVLTMLGFVMLIGVVVNNAILLVEQALHFMHGTGFEGDRTLPPLEAVAASVQSRIRPIFMTALTSVGGMLPLVIKPGAGSELYRGLGAVMVGGLLVATVFTLVLVPLILSVVVEMNEGLRVLFSRAPRTREPERAAPSPPAGEPAMQPA